MKILVYGLNYDPEPVGIGKYTGELATWLASSGHEVRVITAPPYFPHWRVSPPFKNSYSIHSTANVLVYRCPLWIPRNPTGFKRLLHLLSFAVSSFIPLLRQRGWNPDVTITIAPALFCAPGALIFSKIFCRRCKSWLHIQDFELDAAFELSLLNGKWLRRLAMYFERVLLSSFDNVSAISQSMLHSLHKKGVRPNRTIFFPNWVDLTVISPSLLNNIPNPYRVQFDIPVSATVLMYSGSMNKKQDFDLLIDVIHLLSDLPNLFWFFAGDGPSKSDFLRRTVHLSRVIHLPLQPVDRMNEWLNFADIHLLPQKSGTENLVLPSKLLGIFASGKPVVATSFTGSELGLLVSQAGACTSPGDPTAFADAIRLLINDPHYYFSAGQTARHLVEEYFEKGKVLSFFNQQLFPS